ncbi:MAG: glyoxalase [Clostridia bacterium]|nr:glyoxalase [Clostridia bacterium]NCC44802.1 glyoxalase [Clostridia bacterium]
MSEYSKLCVETFLKNQGQLYDEPVAENYQEAEEYLEDCLAVVVKSIKEVREYLDESGMDVDGMSEQELLEASEIFPLEDGTYLIVEG